MEVTARRLRDGGIFLCVCGFVCLIEGLVCVFVLIFDATRLSKSCADFTGLGLVWGPFKIYGV